MPKVFKQNDDELEEKIADWEEFLSGWQLAKKSRNPWRRWGDLTLTIFKRGRGYGWCISGPDDELEFSKETFEFIHDAKSDLYDAVIGY